MRRGLAVALAAAAIATTAATAAATPMPARPVEVDADELDSIKGQSIELFMTVDATHTEIEAVRTVLERSRLVKAFTFTDKEEALAIFRELFRGEPEAETATAAELPVSFELVLQRGADKNRLEEKFIGLGGFEDLTLGPNATKAEFIDDQCKAYADQRERDFNDLEVFMDVDAEAAAVAAVRAAVEGSSIVDHYEFLDKRDALEEFKRLFKDRKKLLRDITADALPQSFRVWMVAGADPFALGDALRPLAGVDDVSVARELLPNIEQLCAAD